MPVSGGKEELAKAVVLVLASAGLRRHDTRTGLVIGAAVGFGYAALESSGYALNAFNGLVTSPVHGGSGLVNMLWIEAERSALAPVLHGLWTAVLGAVIFRAAGRSGRLRLTWGVVGAFFLIVLLHASWDGMDSVAALIAAVAATQPVIGHLQLFAGLQFAGSTGVGAVGVAALLANWRHEESERGDVPRRPPAREGSRARGSQRPLSILSGTVEERVRSWSHGQHEANLADP